MSFEHSALEVKHLWWFQDGAIMSPFARHRLRAAWGFCPRHTWSYFISECELRLMPRGVLILYEDLTSRAEVALGARRWRSRLRPTDACLTCDYLKLADANRIEPGWQPKTDRVNRLVRASRLVALDRERWERRTCPECLGGEGPLCLGHLVAANDRGAAISTADRKTIAVALEDARARMQATLIATCWPRTPVPPGGWAGLIEVLGWFGGWQPVTQIRAEAAEDDECFDLLYAGVGLTRS